MLLLLLAAVSACSGAPPSTPSFFCWLGERTVLHWVALIREEPHDLMIKSSSSYDQIIIII
jgi:hypothetical protein